MPGLLVSIVYLNQAVLFIGIEVYETAYFATDIVDDTELDSNQLLISFCHYDPVPNLLSMTPLL